MPEKFIKLNLQKLNIKGNSPKDFKLLLERVNLISTILSKYKIRIGE